MKKIVVLLAIIVTVTILLYSCGGGGSKGSSTEAGGETLGTVALFATDAKITDLSDFQQVNITLDDVSLLDTGTNATCDLLTTPTSLNLSDLSDTIQLLSISSCHADQFNRIHLVFDKNLYLKTNSASSSCSFTSFKDEKNNPNVLSCSGSTCILDINGAVNVFAGQSGKLSLDFVLKDFDVDNFPGSPCTATMKVSSLNASNMEDREKNQGFKEAVTGTISNLSITSFKLTKGNNAFNVNYSEVTQQGIYQLLQFAQNNGLRVQVKASSIDLTTKTFTASGIFVKVEGTIMSGTISTVNTFTLVFGTNHIIVDFSSAEVEGMLADNTTVEVKLIGFDGTKYIAADVEVENETGVED